MSAKEIVEELRSLGRENYRQIMLSHGVSEPCFGEKIGPVAVDVGDTSCKVPFAPDAIRKAQARGTVGKKRKSAKC